MPKLPNNSTVSLDFPKLKTRGLVEDLELRSGYTNGITTTQSSPKTSPRNYDTKVSDPMVVAKLYAIMEAIADRVEMHKNIGEQRNNWNSLLLTSINTITLTASMMTGMAAMSDGGAPLLALKLSSTSLFLAATGMLFVMNKIQPSQLAEEQRNAARWWPEKKRRQVFKGFGGRKNNNNGWDSKLEEELKAINMVLKRKDEEDYLRLGGKALKLNKALAISGPLLTGLAAVGSALVGTTSCGSLAVMLGIVAGVLSSVVNTLEHGGQVGMVFEMYRSNAGFFRLMEESIESKFEGERSREEREWGNV
ncbi:hypothetical protein Acr_08g0001300 [Actinidia rufa]|uniref:Petal formation-expressed n=1 Tax=Actinidia rufa TaxID=165716 RepID=A0A7J0EZ65_9ERIC|nr:hypothetical protein Acr_08g0001300 [Actinidia rufa]